MASAPSTSGGEGGVVFRTEDSTAAPLLASEEVGTAVDEKKKKKLKKQRHSASQQGKASSEEPEWAPHGLSSFFHRLSRHPVNEEPSTTAVERPTQLAMPVVETVDETAASTSPRGLVTAVDGVGLEAEEGTVVAEDTVSTRKNEELESLERSLLSLLDDFRGGRLRALSDSRLGLMRTVKREHEDLTQLQLSIDSDALDDDATDAAYDGLAARLQNLHANL